MTWRKMYKKRTLAQSHDSLAPRPPRCSLTHPWDAEESECNNQECLAAPGWWPVPPSPPWNLGRRQPGLIRALGGSFTAWPRARPQTGRLAIRLHFCYRSKAVKTPPCLGKGTDVSAPQGREASEQAQPRWQGKAIPQDPSSRKQTGSLVNQ